MVAAGRAGSQADAEHARSSDADSVESAAAACGARYVTPADPEYPPWLEHLDDPPIGLFVRGRPLGDVVPRVAIVGARSCSSLGREIAHDLGRGLASVGVCVVSGAARGIDAEAHRGALAVGGPTLAVLGSGIDVAYPSSSAGLIAQIERAGAVVSEYAPGVPAEPHRFPARNRIVAALSRAVVVVEGGTRSGSKITAEHALDLGRDVFAVPGSVTSPLAAAPHELIRDGAALIRGVGDLLHDLGYDSESLRTNAASPLSAEEAAMLRALAGPALPETVAAALGISVPGAVTVLMRLELSGLVRSVGGRYEATLAAQRARGA